MHFSSNFVTKNERLALMKKCASTELKHRDQMALDQWVSGSFLIRLVNSINLSLFFKFENIENFAFLNFFLSRQLIFDDDALETSQMLNYWSNTIWSFYSMVAPFFHERATHFWWQNYIKSAFETSQLLIEAIPFDQDTLIQW